ncbi:MAG: CHAT domain-containing protein [Kamptonema sp. SIO1D9]|nr:CHAT domain-containing protein [Kamptonema sp. SIO1D9]
MLQKIWRWLKNLIQRLLSPTPPPPPTPRPQPPRKTDTEYENILMELLDGVDAGWSRGKIKGFLIGKNTTDKKLARWLRDFGQRWESTEQHQELGRRLRKLGKEIEGELGQVATAIATRLQPVSPPPDVNPLAVNTAETSTNVTSSQARDANLPPVQRSPEAEALFRRGLNKHQAGDLLDAIANYTQSLQLNPDDYGVYNNRGLAYEDLGRYNEAIADLTQAIQLHRDFYDAYNNRGVAYRDLERYSEAIADFDKALSIKPDFWQAWGNRGWAIFSSRGYQAAIENWDEGLTKLNSDDSQYQIGCGYLHYHQGTASFQQAKQYFEYIRYHDAIKSYRQALNNLAGDNPKLRETYLEVSQDLVIAYRSVGDEEKAKQTWDTAIVILEQWLLEIPDPLNKDYLRRKFDRLYQLEVDRLAQSTNPTEKIQALVLAEARKNLCLTWMQPTPESPHYQEILQLLTDQSDSRNQNRAIIYFHLSPVTITTFILKPNAELKTFSIPVIVFKESSTPEGDNLTPPSQTEIVENLPKQTNEETKNDNDSRDFETWMRKWKQDYKESRKKTATSETEETETPDTWKNNLDSRLNQLASILNLAAIQAEITHTRELILIPHRDLHLLPLHYFFQDTHNPITYLPSAKIGLSLATKPATPLTPNAKLLSIEPKTNAGLLFAELEAAVITHFYQENTHLYANADANNVIAAMQQPAAILHFTGHAEHNLQAANYSALALANQTQLTQKQIFELELPAYELVCLSACETGLTGKSELISEFVGLASTFLAKQTSFVLSTLWTVNEISTALIIIEFYRQLRTGKTPPVALKQAQNWLRRVTYRDLAKWYRELAADVAATNEDCQEDLAADAAIIERDSAKMEANLPPYRSAYYWAGFVLTGKVL